MNRENGCSLDSQALYSVCNTGKDARPDARDSEKPVLKPVLILTTLLFLIVAPEPDSKDIAELTANFIVPENHSVLLASTKQSDSVKREIR